MLKGKDKGTKMTAVPPPPILVGVGVQVVVPQVSTVGVQTDVSRMQVVRETTYALVAALTCTGEGPVSEGVDVEMSGIGGGPAGPSPVSVVPVVPVVPVPGVVRAQALLIHGADCRRGVGALLAAARRLRVVECTVWGVRWLLGVGRHWGSACPRLWCTWTALWWFVVTRCGLGVRFIMWSATFLRGEVGLWWAGRCRGVGGFTVVVFLFFVSFLVHGWGLSTSFCVTSLYVVAAL